MRLRIEWSPDDLIVDRFGLNYDFIEAQGLTWIDNLETSGGKSTIRDTKIISSLYVQDYLERFCSPFHLNDRGQRIFENPRKANALVVRPIEGRQLCRESFEVRRQLAEGVLDLDDE